ncbi:hypothetical protein SDC9_147303 [bioreactor metagenome]|uniref:Uncharacterized protein n=1 Tax=bioreactor metagenome TaxID=1076179 RepID=A0A645EG66_9ZZZZ
MQQQPPHRVGRAAAVVQQFGLRGIGAAIARVDDVLHEGVQQIIQQRHGQGMRADLVLQRREHACPAWGWRVACCNALQFCAVVAQVLQARFGRCIPFVGQVVGCAGKTVDGGNRLAQMGRAQQGRDGKVLVMRHGGGGCAGSGLPRAGV